MVGRSNAISRESCPVQDADDKIDKPSSGGHCLNHGPGPPAEYRLPDVERTQAIPVKSEDAARQQSEFS